MAKRVRKKKPQRKSGGTNWTLILGIAGVGVVGVFALLFASLSGGNRSEDFLANYCESNPQNCMAKGALDAPVTLIEVSDYGCSACRDFNLRTAPALEAQYVETGQVRWITLPFAISGQSGMPTLPSAVAALCANEQGRFFDYHASLFGLQGGPEFNTEAGFARLASELDMDGTAFASCLADNSYSDLVARNSQAARGGARLSRTPTVFINGRRLEGSYPDLSSYQQLIDARIGS